MSCPALQCSSGRNSSAMVTKRVTGNPKGNPLLNYQFSCTFLRADLSKIEIIWISCTNKLSTLGFLFGFSSCRGSFSCISPKATLWDLLLRKIKDLESVFKHLEFCRRKCLHNYQFSSFSLEYQEQCFTAILGSLQKNFQRTALAYRKITEEKEKNGG